MYRYLMLRYKNALISNSFFYDIVIFEDTVYKNDLAVAVKESSLSASERS